MESFETTLKKYLDIFFGQEMYFENDNKYVEMFAKTPTNTNATDIQMKISAINDHEVWANTVTDDMVAHVLALQIDPRLQQGDLSLVDDIAQLDAQGKHFNLLHFASVYCNFHRPDVFPIYNEQHFDFYRKYIAERNLAIDADKLTTYPVFADALNHVTKQFNLTGKMNYLQLRKFAWLYAERVMNESVSVP